MFGLGMGELILILLIALIFIGPKKLPELAKGLGKGIRDFQNAAKGLSDQLQEDEHKTPPQVTDASQQEESRPSAPTGTNEEKEKDSTPS